jgi:hypothetical protein
MSTLNGTEDADFYTLKPIRVTIECRRELVDESTVTILNVEEDIIGRDVLTFRCPSCGKQHKSLRFG